MKNNTSPLITIVTVSLNAGKLLERTIESVCSQDYDNIEYIIIDGNSSDNSILIIEKYLNHISKFVSEPDEGIYDAMNKGIKLASSESYFINFINAGDVFCDSNVVSSVASQANLYKAHIYGNIDKSGQMIRSPDKINKFILSTSMVCHQACFFLTEIHRKYLYDAQFKICADYKLLLELINAGEEFIKIDVTVVKYDVNGVSNTNRHILYTEKIRIKKAYLDVYILSVFKKYLKKLVKTY